MNNLIKNTSKNRLISMISLMGICLLMTIAGIIFKLLNLNNDNKEKKFKVDNFLYFYDEGELLGKYECFDKSCDYATISLVENDFTDSENPRNLKTSLINKRYAFIYDNKMIVLYDVKEEIVLKSFLSVKNYMQNMKDNTYIVEDNGNNWGVISLRNDYKKLIDFEYDYVGIIKRNESTSSDNSTFVTAKDTKWSIINNRNEKLATNIENKIFYYTDLIIITINDNVYTVFDYNNVELLKGAYKKLMLNSDYLEYVDEYNYLNIFDTKLLKNICDSLELSSTDFSGNTLYPPYKVEYGEEKISVTIYSDLEYGTNKITEIEL